MWTNLRRPVTVSNVSQSVQIISGAGSVSLLLVNVATKLSLSGYSKEHELISDVFALLYLNHTGKPREAAASVLRKLRSSEDIEETLTGVEQKSLSHPDTKERLEIVENLDVRPVDAGVFEAFDKDGQLLYQFIPQAEALFQKRSGTKTALLVAEIVVGAAIGDPHSFQTLKLGKKGETITFKTDGKVTLMPLDRLSIAFTRSGSDIGFMSGDFLPQIEGISVARVTKKSSNP